MALKETLECQGVTGPPGPTGESGQVWGIRSPGTPGVLENLADLGIRKKKDQGHMVLKAGLVYLDSGLPGFPRERPFLDFREMPGLKLRNRTTWAIWTSN